MRDVTSKIDKEDKIDCSYLILWISMINDRHLLQERQFIYLTCYSGPNCFCIFLIFLAVVLEASPRFSEIYEIL